MTDDEVLAELDRLYGKIEANRRKSRYDGTDYFMDDEACHSHEDQMHEVALKAIAAGAERSAAIAESALRASGLNFARW